MPLRGAEDRTSLFVKARLGDDRGGTRSGPPRLCLQGPEERFGQRRPVLPGEGDELAYERGLQTADGGVEALRDHVAGWRVNASLEPSGA